MKGMFASIFCCSSSFQVFMIYPIPVYEYELLYWHNFIVHCGSRARFFNHIKNF